MVSELICEDIRRILKTKFINDEFIADKSGAKMIEIVGAKFLANEESIFGNVNHDYVQREIEWYRSESRNVNDIPGKVPLIWKKISSPMGDINSNYGWCIWSEENGRQYQNVKKELLANPDSRRTSMIYQRPSMHIEATEEGMDDFICTYGVDYFIRDSKLHSVVHMRSNDVIYGYKNDRAWQIYVLQMLANDLGYEVGDLHWSVSSLHVYERHFDLLWE